MARNDHKNLNPVVLTSIGLCVASYVVINLLATEPLRLSVLRHLALWPLDSGYTMPWQLFTYGYLHGDLDHLAFNMLALWMFGRPLESSLGKPRFLELYLASLLSAALTQLLVQGFLHDVHPTIGASGAVFGLLMAFGLLFPETKLMLILVPVPIKAKWFVLLYAIVELLLGLTGSMPTVAHFAHLGGLVGAGLVFWRWGWRPGGVGIQR